ncbi:MAG TPA: triose-phosphate isomerase [Thermoanaerobaculia bacterium]|nr:triose-phosphate isomerase [Thermoanaerobaculia bacterium]
MRARRRLFVANWKMTRTPSAAGELARAIAEIARPVDVDVAIAPSFPALDRVRAALLGSGIALAAQDVHGEREGAFTGEVSAAMLKDAGVTLVLVGHSERRRLRGERETDFARKMARLAEEGLAPLYCVGETRKEREEGRTRDVLRMQLGALDGFAAPPPGLTLAYEPVWAIGTGLAATPEMAADAHADLRAELAARFGAQAALSTRILYGGSLSPASAPGLFAKADVDGGLVGGASLSVPDTTALLAMAAASRA